MFLQAALNGARLPSAHPSLPLHLDDLIQDAQAVVAAGATDLHVHVRDPQGRESLAPENVAPVVSALRLACPGIPIGLSTGAWIVPDLAERHRQIQAWRELPDYVSVNFSEDGAEELAASMIHRGVGVEAGLNGPVAAECLMRSDLVVHCLRVLLEPEDTSMADALRTVAAIEAILNASPVATPRLLHGVEATAWPLLREAARRGQLVRIGFEDVLTLPDGSPAKSNADLVRRAQAI